MDRISRTRCILANETDLDNLINLQYDACVDYPFHDAVWGKNNEHNRSQAKNRLLQKWRETRDFSVVKCLEESSGELMAWCIWEVIGIKESRKEALEEDVMNNCDWLDGEARELARAHMIPAVHKRWDIMQGRAYMLLTNLCTAPKFRNRGSASALTEWGLEQAKQKEIPAYCEASEMSTSMYNKLGFKKVGTVETRINGKLIDECDVMTTI